MLVYANLPGAASEQRCARDRHPVQPAAFKALVLAPPPPQARWADSSRPKPAHRTGYSEHRGVQPRILSADIQWGIMTIKQHNHHTPHQKPGSARTKPCSAGSTKSLLFMPPTAIQWGAFTRCAHTCCVCKMCWMAHMHRLQQRVHHTSLSS